MTSSNQAARVPDNKPEVVEEQSNVRPLPKPQTKPTKFVIKIASSVPN
ncbi:MAG TPA: hypothetical protein VF376_13475 [Thermoanaerobaculia bacterium]